MRIKGMHVLVTVSDLDASTGYYEKLLGMAPSYSLAEEVGFVIADGMSINLHQVGQVTPREIGTIAVRDIAVEVARLRGVGLETDGDPRPTPDGHATICKVVDPDGNVLEIAQ